MTRWPCMIAASTAVCSTVLPCACSGGAQARHAVDTFADSGTSQGSDTGGSQDGSGQADTPSDDASSGAVDGSAGPSGTDTSVSTALDASRSDSSTATLPSDASGDTEGVAPASLCAAVGGQTVITVAAEGSGQFRTVQSAVDSIAAGTSPVRIDVKPGTYTENLTIANRANIALCGEDPMATVITYAMSGSSEAAATRVSADHFSAANVTFENSSALGSGQAVALLASGSEQQFIDCRFVSYQDTLYTKAGSQYFKNCYVQGNTDYVFGAATAVLDDCSVYSISGGTAVTAPNTSATTPYGIVFLGGVLTAASSVRVGSVALGRPWGPAGSTTYVRTSLGPHISAVGWVAFGSNPVAGARFAEYQSSGPGANPTMRAAGSSQLTDAQAAKYTIADVLGGWIPTFSQ